MNAIDNLLDLVDSDHNGEVTHGEIWKVCSVNIRAEISHFVNAISSQVVDQLIENMGKFIVLKCISIK
jgi:hypothetical protein